MKKIIKEQSLMSTFNNKKVNLYSDPENKNFIGQATIMSVDPINSKDKRNWLGNAVFEIQIRQKDPANGREAQVKLNFLCGTLPFPDTKNKKAGLYFDNGNRQVYSYNFEEALKKFCTVSKGGAAVPKADFVSTNATRDQVMGEGKKVVRLSESDLIKIVKRVIKEQNVSNSETAMLNGLLSLACGTVNGIIQQGHYKGQKFCDVLKKYNLTEAQKEKLDEMRYDKCQYTITFMGQIAGWNEIVNYYKSGTNGSKIEQDVYEGYSTCENNHTFIAKNPDGSKVDLVSDGTGSYYRKDGARGVSITWKWENNKPVFEGIAKVTRNAQGYAQTEEEITSGKKILGVGSTGDLVKRIQFEIVYYTDGKTNPGCKADQDGKYSPALCDGIYGRKTKDGVREFQTSNGLSPDGNVGAETWQVMEPFGLEKRIMI